MEGDRDDYLFLMNAPNIYFFQLPNLNIYCLEVEMAPAHQVIKKLKMDRICGSSRCIPLHVTTATECAKKTKGICQLTEILNTYTR